MLFNSSIIITDTNKLSMNLLLRIHGRNIGFSVHRAIPDKPIAQTQLWSFITSKNSLSHAELQRTLPLPANWYAGEEKRILVSWIATMYQIIRKRPELFADIGKPGIEPVLGDISAEY